MCSNDIPIQYRWHPQIEFPSVSVVERIGRSIAVVAESKFEFPSDIRVEVAKVGPNLSSDVPFDSCVATGVECKDVLVIAQRWLPVSALSNCGLFEVSALVVVELVSVISSSLESSPLVLVLAWLWCPSENPGVPIVELVVELTCRS